MKTLPPSWTEGTITNIRCRGGHQISVRWKAGAMVSATMLAGRTGEVVLELPETTVDVIGPSGPLTIRPASGAVPGRIRVAWNATVGARYAIVPR
jgi:alpha-L-fucosidase 2